MGNQNSCDRLVPVNKDDSEWQTVGFVSKSQIDESQARCYSVKKTGYSTVSMSKSAAAKVVGNNSSRHNRRWSQNRKVNENKVRPTRLLTSKRTPLRTMQDGTMCYNNSDKNVLKFNSTICDGGVSLVENQIFGFSPIKQTSIRRRISSRPSLVNKLATTPVDCSRTKVQKWLASTDKKYMPPVKDYYPEALDPIITNLAKNALVPDFEGRRDDTLVSKSSISSLYISDEKEEEGEDKLLDGSSHQKNDGIVGGNVGDDVDCCRVVGDIGAGDVDGDVGCDEDTYCGNDSENPSPIASEYNYYENENTLESCIADELTEEAIMKKKNNSAKSSIANKNLHPPPTKAKAKKRKKRRCIGMPRNFERHNEGHTRKSKAKNRLDGKELKLGNVCLVSMKVDVKDITNSRPPIVKYNLRSRRVADINDSSTNENVFENVLKKPGKGLSKKAKNQTSKHDIVSVGKHQLVDRMVKQLTEDIVHVDDSHGTKKVDDSHGTKKGDDSHGTKKVDDSHGTKKVIERDSETLVEMTSLSVEGDGETPHQDAIMKSSAVTSSTTQRILFPKDRSSRSLRSSPKGIAMGKKVDNNNKNNSINRKTTTSNNNINNTNKMNSEVATCCLESLFEDRKRDVQIHRAQQKPLVQYESTVSSSVSSDCLCSSP